MSREDSPLEEIIVSARKRDESLATVPASITVFTSETLQNYDIQSFDDYATKTPNVSSVTAAVPRVLPMLGPWLSAVLPARTCLELWSDGLYIDDTRSRVPSIPRARHRQH